MFKGTAEVLDLFVVFLLIRNYFSKCLILLLNLYSFPAFALDFRLQLLFSLPQHSCLVQSLLICYKFGRKLISNTRVLRIFMEALDPLPSVRWVLAMESARTFTAISFLLFDLRVLGCISHSQGFLISKLYRSSSCVFWFVLTMHIMSELTSVWINPVTLSWNWFYLVPRCKELGW